MFESIESTPKALNRSELLAAGFDGMIAVEADDMDIDLDVIPGFWSAKLDAEAELTLNHSVDGLEGRLIGGSVEGDDDKKALAGFACEGGANAIGGAVEGPMKDATKRLAERLSNAPRLRRPSSARPASS